MLSSYQAEFEKIAFATGTIAPSGEALKALALLLAGQKITPEDCSKAVAGVVCLDYLKENEFPSARAIVRAIEFAKQAEAKKIESAVYFLAHAKSSAEVLEKFPTINIEHIKRIKKAQKVRRGGLEGQKSDFRAYLLDPSKIDEIAPFLLECGKDEKPVNEDPEELERIKRLFLVKEESKQSTQGA